MEVIQRDHYPSPCVRMPVEEDRLERLPPAGGVVGDSARFRFDVVPEEQHPLAPDELLV
jgi:hypothetical protein